MPVLLAQIQRYENRWQTHNRLELTTAMSCIYESKQLVSIKNSLTVLVAFTGSSKKAKFTNEVIMSQTQASVWSYRTQSDTVRRTVGPRSVTLNSYRQTTASLHFCCWPDDQRETLSKNNHGHKKKYLYQKSGNTIQKKRCMILH